MVLNAGNRVMQFLFNAARPIISSLPIFKLNVVIFIKGFPISICRWSVSAVLYLSCSPRLNGDRRKITLREINLNAFIFFYSLHGQYIGSDVSCDKLGLCPVPVPTKCSIKF
jgi:hypothetical protein